MNISKFMTNRGFFFSAFILAILIGTFVIYSIIQSSPFQNEYKHFAGVCLVDSKTRDESNVPTLTEAGVVVAPNYLVLQENASSRYKERTFQVTTKSNCTMNIRAKGFRKIEIYDQPEGNRLEALSNKFPKSAGKAKDQIQVHYRNYCQSNNTAESDKLCKSGSDGLLNFLNKRVLFLKFFDSQHERSSSLYLIMINGKLFGSFAFSRTILGSDIFLHDRTY